MLGDMMTGKHTEELHEQREQKERVFSFILT